MTMYIFSRYNLPYHDGEANEGPTMTQQHFKEECDINHILKKFVATGILPNVGPGVYADLGDQGDYRESIQRIRDADEMFLQLPSTIRKEFQNDPGAFLAFVQNPANLERGIELGIFQADAKTVGAPNSSQNLKKQAPENPNNANGEAP